MITIAQVRVEIGDQPRWASNPQGRPEVLASSADGVNTTFYLRFPNVYGTTARVYLGTPVAGQPTSWALVQPNDATNPWMLTSDANGQPIILFTAAPPPAGKVVAARYMFTAFTDAQIQDQMNLTPAHDTDQRSLWAVHLAMIPAILANRDAMLIKRNGDVTEDPSLWARAQSDLAVHLTAMLQPEDIGEPPYMGIGGYSTGSGYQP